MIVNKQRFYLLTIGLLLFSLFGCDSERDDHSEENNPLHPDGFSSENVQFLDTETGGLSNVEVFFEENLLPILSARCAFAGCHVAGGPDNLDFSSYQTFIRGGEDGDLVFRPGNAQDSDIIEEIVSGRMPPGGPRLPDAQIQLFTDWINQQELQSGIVRRDHDDGDDDDD